MAAKAPTYNVLLPVRNGEATIETTMDSILGQSLPPSAVSVAEDGSTDGTAAILGRYEKDYPGTVSVTHTGSTTTDFTRIPRLLNMGLDRRYDYHMLGAGDCDFARDYAEIIVSRMESDPSIAVASGDYNDPPAHDPRGAGRFVRQAWFFSERGRYPEMVGFEPETVLRAKMSGMSAAVYADARYVHLDRLGHSHNFSEFGHSMRALGYHPLYALGRCAKCMLGSDIPRRGALNMLWQYAAYRPSGGYYSAYPAEFRAGVRRMQSAAIRRALGLGPSTSRNAPMPGKRPFTVVVPFRDTPAGRAFAKRSLPSAAALGPDEIVVGVDAPAAPGLEEFLAGAAAAEGGGARRVPLRAVPVERSGEWRMHAAHVVHECLSRCRTDAVLLYNIDTVLRPGALGGLSAVGRDGVSLVSYALRMRTDGPGARLRYLAYRARSRVRGTANSGMFWLHLPDYRARIDPAGYAAISNGFDTYIFEAMAAGPGTRAVTVRTLGADAMDRENGDLEWRQFGYGLWLYARRSRAGGGRASALRGAAAILKHAAVNCHPYSLKGWNWARSHPESEPVRIAAKSDYIEWTTYHEPGQVRSLADWPQRGTGFAG